ncbi:MAG TPA: pyridoxamine 5'-phosphate oxidase family protein [Gammaproteobacteria bacterium]
MAAEMTDDELRTSVLGLLDAHTVLSLATLHRGGAHAASLMYARDGYTLYWLSSTGSRHSQALAEQPRVTATVAGQFTDFREIRGLQLSGTASLVSVADESRQAMEHLAARYPFLALFQSGVGRLAQRLADSAVYRLTPAAITLIDNTRGFGFKQTLRP